MDDEVKKTDLSFDEVLYIQNDLQTFDELIEKRKKLQMDGKYQEQMKKYCELFAIDENIEPDFIKKEFNIPSGCKFDSELLERQLKIYESAFGDQRVSTTNAIPNEKISYKGCLGGVVYLGQPMKSSLKNEIAEMLNTQFGKEGHIEK